jgi:membrane-bound serine protease (ClpP class)
MLRKLLICLFLVSLLAASLVTPAQAVDNGKVLIIHLKGEIDAEKVALLHRALASLEKERPEAVIVELDTFGGRVDAATEIRDKISALPNTICYIKNRAWSAGALIAIAHTHIAIAPGGSIGAAEPIPATEKTIAALKAEFAATANKTGRNARVAQAMVDKTSGLPGYAEPGQILALTDYQAKDLGYADIVAPDMESVLAHYGLSGTKIEDYQANFADKAAGWLSSDAVKSILLTIIFLAIFTEVKTAGLGIAGLFGVMAAILFFTGQYLNGMAGWLEIMLFLAGIMLLIMELFIPGFGLWGISGMGCILGSFFLALGSNQAALNSMAVSLIIAILLFLVILRRLPTSRLWNKLILKETETTEAGFTSGHNYEKYLGKSGVAITLLRPAGIAEFDGEQLDVVSEGQYIEAGTKVKVVKAEGSRIIVKAVKE